MLPLIVPVIQLTVGLAASRNGYPRIRSSSLIFATRNRWRVAYSPNCIMKFAVCVTPPIRFGVPSTFRTLRIFRSRHNGIFNSSTSRGWMKLSIAPESNNASLSACLPSVHSETGIFIDLFRAMYIESVMQARARAVALRPVENPSCQSPLLLSIF